MCESGVKSSVANLLRFQNFAKCERFHPQFREIREICEIHFMKYFCINWVQNILQYYGLFYEHYNIQFHYNQTIEF